MFCHRSARTSFSPPSRRSAAAKAPKRISTKSLRALKTDYLDLWQIHQVSTMEEVEQIFAPGGAIEAFEAAKKAGKCRFMGFTGHHDPEVHLAMLKSYDKYDTILMPLNPGRSFLPKLRENGPARRGRARNGNSRHEEHGAMPGCWPKFT